MYTANPYQVQPSQVQVMFDQQLQPQQSMQQVVYNSTPVPAPIPHAAGPHAMIYKPGQMSNSQKKEEGKAAKHAENAMHKAAQNAGPTHMAQAVTQSYNRMATAMEISKDRILHNADRRAGNRARAWGPQ